MNLLVTFKTTEDQKKIIEEQLKKYVEIHYLDCSKFEKSKILLNNAEILFCWNIAKELSKEDYKELRSCKFIQLLSAGANHVPFKLINEKVIIASNVGAYAKPMAEHVISMVLALSKSLLPRHLELKKGIFNQHISNKLIDGSTCGILGFGGIGKATAHLLKSFHVKIFAINTSGNTDEGVDFIGTLNDLDFVLKSADIVIITLPLNKYTFNLINKDKLELMKKDAILVNVARGEIIVEEDLFNFLQRNNDFKVALDAWWIEPFSHGFFKTNFPFFDLPNFLGSPHNSAIVPGVIENALDEAVGNIINYIMQNRIKGIVKRDDYIFNESSC